MHWGLHLWVVGGNEKGSGERSHICTASAVMTLYTFTLGDKNTQSFPVSLSYSHTHTHTLRAGAPSTRKETEIGNKDHPLCLRTVNGSSNVFNLSPESNNGAHSTPPRYCSTVRLKALGFYHPSLSQFLSLFSPLCAVHEGINLWDKETGVLLRKKKKREEELWREEKGDKWMRRWGADE